MSGVFDKRSSEWLKGSIGEAAVIRYFQHNGWVVVPTTAIEMGGAPRLIGHLRSVLPDIQTFRRGMGRWVEIKTKEGPVEFPHRTGKMRHGIDWPHWLDYLEVAKETGLPGALAIVELTRDQGRGDLPVDPLLLVADFKDLSATYVSPDVMNKWPSGMARFDRDNFQIKGQLDLSKQGLGLPPINTPDETFPNLPKISEQQWASMSHNKKLERHMLEVAEAQKIFDARQADGMGIFEAAQNLPVPRMHRRQ